MAYLLASHLLDLIEGLVEVVLAAGIGLLLLLVVVHFSCRESWVGGLMSC